MRTLIFHIGPPKTGTSAIQHLLSTNHVKGAAYPRIGLWPDGAHHNMVFSFYKQDARPQSKIEPFENVLSEIKSFAEATSENIVISSEALASRAYAGGFIEAVVHQLGALFDRIKIVAVVREHAELSASIYNQIVKDSVTREARLPDEFIQEFGSSFRYSKILARFEASGIDLAVLNYHPASGLINRFLDVVGAESTSIPGSWRNTSLSIKGLIGVLAINQVVFDAVEREKYFTALRKLRLWSSRPGMIYSSSVLSEVMRNFDEDRDMLASKWGISLPYINPAYVACDFYLARKDVEEISGVIRGTGARDDEVIERLLDYVRPGAS